MGKRAIPVVLTENEQDKLLDQFNTRYVTSQRNKVMFQLMLNTGLRVSEAVSLRWQDVNLTSGKVMVREGKGAKDRTLWVDNGQLEEPKKWKERQVEKVGELPKWVFSTLKEGNAGKKISIQQVWKTLKTYAEKAGIEKDISPHTLRHTFATDLYRKTGKIRLVQKALGHADLSTTMIYTHIVDEELEGAMKSFRVTERQPVGI
ncbi:MAG: tyrosine-type recombinase/integrase [Candidatus Bipolaricaulota bacterium]|nr:tyrosine-type recombinase/integrase [Candidatus Bipolaricaulota bacterium]